MTEQANENQNRGAVCDDCDQHMLEVDGCSLEVYVHPEGDKVYPRIKYGHETRANYGRNDDGSMMKDWRCSDCGCFTDNFHHPGCDVEECPRCHRQFISCDCNWGGEGEEEDEY